MATIGRFPDHALLRSFRKGAHAKTVSSRTIHGADVNPDRPYPSITHEELEILSPLINELARLAALELLPAPSAAIIGKDPHPST